MNTSRRGFLQLLGSSALVLQASPTSFFDMGPSVALGAERGYNSFMSLDWITREALKVLNNNLVFAQHVNRSYDGRFKKGDIITLGRGSVSVLPSPIYPAREWSEPVHIVGEAGISEAAQSIADEIDRRGLEIWSALAARHGARRTV